MGSPIEQGEVLARAEWRDVAGQIAAVIRVSGLEIFREAVRQAAQIRQDAEDKGNRREEARREELKKHGVWENHQPLPRRPGDKWFYNVQAFRGSIRLPPEIALPPGRPERPIAPACLRDSKRREEWNDSDRNEVHVYHEKLAAFRKEEQEFWRRSEKAGLPVFEYTKAHGFPGSAEVTGDVKADSADEDAYLEYEFWVCGWLPPDLHTDKDPPKYELLPVPKRALTDAEKMTVLSAMYDAHWRGSTKVAPWGVSEDGAEPAMWPTEAERDERRLALWYHLLVAEAERATLDEVPVLWGWLEQLPLHLPERKSNALAAGGSRSDENLMGKELGGGGRKGSNDTTTAEKPLLSQQPDGPGDEREFWWKGRRVVLSPQQWKLLGALWKAPIIQGDRKVCFAELGEEVWGNDCTPNSTIKAAVSRLNSALLENEVQLSVSTRQENAVLSEGS